ncbi:MAG: response regulator [Desulfofustis sp.]|nr:response regulator [Desulfofustis sp.]
MTKLPVKVMVVEDEVLIGLMIVRKLQAQGYQVDQVITTGEEAVHRAGQQDYDVILMDVTLAGELNGIDAARQIKERYGIPIIVYSGYDDKQFYEQVGQLKPVEVVKKLGPISDITAAIDRAVGRQITSGSGAAQE